jgi:hypothetical protein
MSGARYTTRYETISFYLFWHGSEGKRLWVLAILLAIHVELSSIAAVFFKYGDMMIGRNAPNSAALLGATEPHLNSSTSRYHFVLIKVLPTDSALSWDAADHPENWVRPKRSSSMLKLVIPAIFCTPLYYTLTTVPFDGQVKAM